MRQVPGWGPVGPSLLKDLDADNFRGQAYIGKTQKRSVNAAWQRLADRFGGDPRSAQPENG